MTTATIEHTDAVVGAVAKYYNRNHIKDLFDNSESIDPWHLRKMNYGNDTITVAMREIGNDFMILLGIGSSERASKLAIRQTMMTYLLSEQNRDDAGLKKAVARWTKELDSDPRFAEHYQKDIFKEIEKTIVQRVLAGYETAKKRYGNIPLDKFLRSGSAFTDWEQIECYVCDRYVEGGKSVRTDNGDNFKFHPVCLETLVKRETKAKK